MAFCLIHLYAFIAICCECGIFDCIKNETVQQSWLFFFFLSTQLMLFVRNHRYYVKLLSMKRCASIQPPSNAPVTTVKMLRFPSILDNIVQNVNSKKKKHLKMNGLTAMIFFWCGIFFYCADTVASNCMPAKESSCWEADLLCFFSDKCRIENPCTQIAATKTINCIFLAMKYVFSIN